MTPYSDFLFTRSTFLGGMARVMDLGGTLVEFNRSPDGQTADSIALTCDWFAIGDDIRQTMEKFRQEHCLSDK